MTDLKNNAERYSLTYFCGDNGDDGGCGEDDGGADGGCGCCGEDGDGADGGCGGCDGSD